MAMPALPAAVANMMQRSSRIGAAGGAALRRTALFGHRLPGYSPPMHVGAPAISLEIIGVDAAKLAFSGYSPPPMHVGAPAISLEILGVDAAKLALLARVDTDCGMGPLRYETDCPSYPSYIPVMIVPPGEVSGGLPIGDEQSFELPTATPDSPATGPDGPGAEGPAPLECHRMPKRRRNSRGLEEKWWLEYDPPKGFFPSQFGKGPHGGSSIHKQDWPRQMVPIRYKENWMRRERQRHGFRKNGFEYDVPKWGG